MKRVKWPFAPRRMAGVRAVAPRTLAVAWDDGSTAHIDLGPWIEARPELARLREDPDFFATAHVGAFGGTVSWIDDLIEIDSVHLQLLESEGRGLPLLPDALLRWRNRHGLTQVQAARALGLSVRQWQNYESGQTFVPYTVALACAGYAATRSHAA